MTPWDEAAVERAARVLCCGLEDKCTEEIGLTCYALKICGEDARAVLQAAISPELQELMEAAIALGYETDNPKRVSVYSLDGPSRRVGDAAVAFARSVRGRETAA